MRIGIIGAGAAGMTAAIIAKRNGADVTLIEHMPRIGKKILITGSGKCNLSNADMDISHFHSENIEFVADIFRKCSPSEALSFLKSIGIFTKDRNGYLYPLSEQASVVLDCFRFELRDIGVKIITDTHVKTIKHKNNVIMLNTDKENFVFDKVIVCCGSKAYKNTGSDGSGYILAKETGHNIIKPLASLTYFNCEENFFPSIAGIRTKALINLFVNNNKTASEVGELQITKNGISGIPVFNLSYIASKSIDADKKTVAEVDFLPDYNFDDVKSVISKRIKNYKDRPLEELFSGIFHKNLGNLFIKLQGLKLSDKCGGLKEKDIVKLTGLIKCLPLKISSCGGFDNSQVCSGGVDTKDLTLNLESKNIPGLYFAGEIIDVNGDCGGYNLTWAFCSGILAGNSSSL